MTRTLLMWKTAKPPHELYELVREASTILFMAEENAPRVQPTAIDHVVVWNEPKVEVDHRTLLWPTDANLVRLLLQAEDSRRLHQTAL